MSPSERAYYVTEFIVEGIPCAGEKIDAARLDGNRAVAVNFKLPDEFIAIRQLGDRQALHRFDERGGLLFSESRLALAGCTRTRQNIARLPTTSHSI